MDNFSSDLDPKKRKWPWLFSICLFLGVCILAFGLTPTFLSSKTGKNLVIKHLSNKLDGKLSIEKLSINWFSPISIQGVEFKDEKKQTALSFESLTITSTLWNFIFSYEIHGKTTIDSLYLQLDPSAYKKTQGPQNSNGLFQQLSKNLEVKNAKILILDPVYQNIEWDKLFLTSFLKKKDTFEFEMRGLSKMVAHAGKFQIQGHFNPNILRNKNASFHDILDNLNVNLSCHAINFPLIGIDRLIDLSHPQHNSILSSAFGPIINSDIELSISKDSKQAQINMLSKFMKVNLKSLSNDKGLSLSQNAYLSFNVGSDLYSSIAHRFDLNPDLTLTKDGYFQLFIENFFVPKVGKRFDFENTSLAGRFVSSALTFQIKEIKDLLSFNTLSVAFSSKNIAKQLELSLQSSINYQARNPANINVSTSVNNPFSKSSWLSHKPFSYFKADISKFPTIFLDKVFKLDNKLVDLIGDTFSFKTASKRFPEKLQLTNTFLSPKLHIPIAITSIDESIYLEKPAGFVYLPNTENLLNLLSTKHVQFKDLSKIKGKVEAFGISLENLSKKNYSKIILQLDVDVDNLKLGLPGTKEVIAFGRTKTNLNLDTLDKIKFKTTSNLHFDNNDHKALILGRDIRLFFNGTINLENLSDIQIPSLAGTAKSDRLDLKFHTAFEEHFKKLRFIKPLTIELMPSSEFINFVLAHDNPHITYVPSSLALISINPKPLRFDSPVFHDLEFEADISLKKLDLVNKDWYKQFSFENTAIVVNGNTHKKTFSVDLKSHAEAEKTSAGVLHAHISSNDFSSFDFLKKNISSRLTLKEFSSNLLDSLFGYQNTLKAYIGNSFDVTLNYNKEAAHGKAKVDFDSSKLKLDAKLDVSQNISINPNSPAKLTWEITNDVLTSLQGVFNPDSKHQYLKLSKPVSLSAKINKLDWPRQVSSSDNHRFKHFIDQLKSSAFVSELNIGSAEFVNKREKFTTTFHGLAVNFDKDSAKSPFSFDIVSNIDEVHDKHPKVKGSLQAKGTLETLLANNSPIRTDIHGKLEHFPTFIIDSLLKTFGINIYPSMLLGSEVSARLSTKLEDLSGVLDFDIVSPQANLNFNTYLNDGILKLTKPIKGELEVTENLSENLLKNMGISLAQASSPISLFVSDKGFYMPVHPFKFEDIQVRYGALDLKKLICYNKGSPNDIGDIFKLSNNSSKQIQLWFAPSEFSISNGFLNVDRTEVLFDKALQIAFWGHVNMPKRFVNMTLGLTEQALREALGLRGLPRDFVLQVPVTGPIENVKINKQLAATRIAFLLARTSGATRHAGALGSIFDVLGELAQDQGSVPPPKKPFPWDKELGKLLEQSRKDRSLEIIR